jgi:hypothetical protein
VDLESSLIGDSKFAKPLNYCVWELKNLKQTPKQDLDFLMARKKGSASTVMLSEEQLKDICGEGSLVCVPRRWLKELGFDPEQKSKARVLTVHSGKEVWCHRDWEEYREKIERNLNSLQIHIPFLKDSIKGKKDRGDWRDECPKLLKKIRENPNYLSENLSFLEGEAFLIAESELLRSRVKSSQKEKRQIEKELKEFE